ncbi:MAG: response regulator [Cyanobacteria bacterium J06597_16]
MQKTISGSFRLRLMALVMLGIFPPLLGATSYASYRADKIFRADAQQNMTVKADALGEHITQWHEQNLQVLDDLRAGTDFSTMQREQQLPTMLSTLQARKADVETVATIDTDGNVVADVSARPNRHSSYQDEDWFQDTLARARSHSQETLVPERGEPTVLFSKPILARPTLRVGDRNTTVTQLQTRLQNLGYYSGPIDGIYEGATVEAIRQFKQAFNQDGTHAGILHAGTLGDQVDSITWQTIELAEQAKTEEIAPIVAEVTRTASRLDVLQSETTDVEGVVMMEAQLDEVTEAVSQVDIGYSGYAIVVDDDGQVLAHSKKLPKTLKTPALPPADSIAGGNNVGQATDQSTLTPDAATDIDVVGIAETGGAPEKTAGPVRTLEASRRARRRAQQYKSRSQFLLSSAADPSAHQLGQSSVTSSSDSKETATGATRKAGRHTGQYTTRRPKMHAAAVGTLPLNQAGQLLSHQFSRFNTPSAANPISLPISLAAKQPDALTTLPNLSHFEPVADLLQGKSGALTFENQGEQWIAHGKTLNNGWSVLLLQPNVDFSREARLFRHRSVGIAAIALVTAAGAIVILSARLTKPIHQLSTAATALSQGQLDQKIDIQSDDEIGTLATAFNSVAGQLQVSFSQLADQNESLKRLDQLKDQFLANTSHELKTPLNGMIGIAESLLEGAAGNLTDLQKQNVAMIASSSHRLTRLVNDILDFSKLQHQQLNLHRKALGIRASVDVVLALSRSLMGHQRIELINDIPADLPLVYADENRLQQILLNLVGNAIKFTESGTVTVSAIPMVTEAAEDASAEDGAPAEDGALAEEALEKAPTHMAISIHDTGIGIAQNRLENIFEPFQQIENSAKSYGGTGLGLSITRNLVSLHQGKIWADSTLAKGSTFTFTLPLASTSPQPPLTLEKTSLESASEPLAVQAVAQNVLSVDVLPAPEDLAEQPANKRELSQIQSLRQRAKLSKTLAKVLHPKKEKARATVQQLNTHKFNILVVDDEPINVQVLKNHLALENYTVTQALTGAEALALVKAGQQNNKMFDLIVLDVMMPRMSGYEVCAKLREFYPAHELPVVMLTAKNQVSDLITGFQFGANDYMTKPFSKDELLTRIQSHLRLSKTSHAYGRFVPSEYLRFLGKESIVDVQLGDHVSKEMAVMFSDIRAFTTLSESMTPQENFDFVNAYLRQVSPAIRAQGGFIVKYLGDGMMAVFPQGADDAIAAGLAKLRSVEDYNQKREAQGFLPIAVGIGIHFGHMMVGMVGESARMQGDAFSDNVNLTARLESLTKLYGVSMIISDRAHSLLSDAAQYTTRFLDRVIVKGRSESIDLYHVLEGESAQVIELIQQTQPTFETGIAHYQAGDFQQAQTCFQQVLVQYPESKAAQVYCDRIATLMQNPPTQWRGVWKLAKK